MGIVKQTIMILLFSAIVSWLPGESWTFITEDSEMAPERYSVGGLFESPVVETDYMSSVVGEMKITAVDFLDDISAVVIFANHAYRAKYMVHDFSHFLFVLPNSGMVVLLVSPENNGERVFAYSLEQDFAPFSGVDPVLVGDSELKMLQELGLDDIQICAVLRYGTRYIRYRGIVKVSKP